MQQDVTYLAAVATSKQGGFTSDNKVPKEDTHAHVHSDSDSDSDTHTHSSSREGLAMESCCSLTSLFSVSEKNIHYPEQVHVPHLLMGSL